MLSSCGNLLGMMDLVNIAMMVAVTASVDIEPWKLVTESIRLYIQNGGTSSHLINLQCVN